MELSLLTSGGIFAVLFVLYSVLQTIRGRFHVNFLATLLAFAATLPSIVALILNQQSPNPLPLINFAAVGIAVVVIAFSGIVLFVEHRRSRKNRNDEVTASRGMLGIGVGSLLIAAVFAAPLTTGMVMPAAPQVDIAATVVAQLPQEAAQSAVQVESVALQTTREATATPTPSRTPQPLPLLPTIPPALLTIPAIDATEEATATSSAEAEAAESTGEAVANTDCFGTITQGLNMRSAANVDARIIRTIPAGTDVPIFGQSRGGFWLSTNYQDTQGWVSSQYVALSASCMELPELPSN